MTKINLTIGKKEYFKGIGKIEFEGRKTRNPLAFQYYDEERIIAGKTMKEHLRFAVSYWHSFCGTGGDPFGQATKQFPWSEANNPNKRAREKMDAAFEFITKLGVPFYCFHDYDLVEEGNSVKESTKRLHKITDYALDKQEESGVKLLWGTANLFAHPRYMNGAATNPNLQVVAHAAAQVKNAIDATIKLGGQNYVFWGGREGYLSLINTDMERELQHLAQFLSMARDYGRAQGFKGNFLIEPKPSEPSKHQYDFDAATVLNFLREYDLLNDFKLNLEVNHATLAGHTFQHEIAVAANAGVLGSIDANRGDYQNGWDTDQFPNNSRELVETFLTMQEGGGLKGGGINFDAKTRRNSTDLADLFYAHIGGIDAFAKALLIADEIMRDSDYLQMRAERYSSFNNKKGRRFEKGKMDLETLAKMARKGGEPEQISGQQELMENLIGWYL